MANPQVVAFFQAILNDIDPALSLQFLADRQPDTSLNDTQQATVVAVIALLFDRYEQVTLKDLEAAATLASVAEVLVLLNDLYQRLRT